ncbi:methyltransferase [Desulfobacterales bacterium HSG2]|nr:methyltransferase [Desulfobacterales bacterium HSG2]
MIFAKESLSSDGTLYLLELLLSEELPDGGLLDLNMLATTGGRERSYEAFSELLASAGFVVYEKNIPCPM